MKEKIPLYIIGGLVLFLLLNMLVGCKTKTVTEYVAVHDTTLVSKTDTLVKVKTEFSHDTLRVETEKIITITEKGETLKVVEWRDRWRDRYVTLTDTMVKSKTDTVYISKDKDHDVVKVKQHSLLKPVLVVALIAFVASIFLIYHKR